MIVKRFVWLLAVLLVLAGGAYYWYDLKQVEAEQPSVIAKTIDACDGIAEKAAMHLPEKLPFQRLEKHARRMRVFDVCMHDRGFEQNKAWTTFAEVEAKVQAKEQNISESEAYENMRRFSMLLPKPVDGQPVYWAAAKKQSGTAH